MTLEILDALGTELHSRNITLETDIDGLEIFADQQLVRAAAESLVRHAIDAMPRGGDMTVTLVNGTNQWELEVTDSVGEAVRRTKVVNELQPRPTSDHSVPMVIAFSFSHHLQTAHRAAMQLGGQVHCWDCPQGGTAYVLIIPKPLARRAA